MPWALFAFVEFEYPKCIYFIISLQIVHVTVFTSWIEYIITKEMYAQKVGSYVHDTSEMHFNHICAGIHNRMTVLPLMQIPIPTLRFATATRFPQELISNPVISFILLAIEDTWHKLNKSQISTLQSFPPEIIKLPAGLNTTEETDPVWGWNSLSSFCCW